MKSPQTAARLFGYLGYDLVRQAEHLPNVSSDPLNLPDTFLIWLSVLVVLDGIESVPLLRLCGSNKSATP
ncbi:MAG: hypothetical protein OXE94_15350 [Aestuariivita sp.]|nr:hypothetical protein [Aestuariivita sp.]MCY4203078.1 hypothetical protein [Aestuariivita sp.]